MRMTDSIKSGICKSLIWAFEEGSHCVCVPVVPEAAELLLILRKRGDSMAQYRDSKTGKLLKEQWKLTNGQDRALIRAAKEYATCVR